MNPFIRSLDELMVITKPRVQIYKNTEISESEILCEDSGQRKRYIRSKNEKEISLPNLREAQTTKEIIKKGIFSKSFDKIDYRNRLPSRRGPIIIDRNNNDEQLDVA
tara:strand:- start:409 stop:729 length:321 start_codon:yes stop_codon:yes gene_type:complete